MRYRVRAGAEFGGVATMPGDKSISHRAVMFGSIAEGSTEIEGLLLGDDCLSTVRAFRNMGVGMEFDGTTCLIHGQHKLAEPAEIIDVGNSGTTMRLMLGLLSGAGLFAVMTGDSSIRRRPMGRVTEPLRAMGASIGGRQGGTLAPLAVGPAALHGMRYASPIASAQVKSAILLAGLAASGETEVTEPALSRDHTERMLRQFGAVVGKTSDGLTTSIAGGQKLTGCKVVVPGDISSGAFFLAAGALAEGRGVSIERLGVNPTRSGILEVMGLMGAQLQVSDSNTGDTICGSDMGEPIAKVHVSRSSLQGCAIGGEMIPRLIDELPVISILAAFAEGTTEIRDAQELRVKESDRIDTIGKTLRQGGIPVTETPDGFVVQGLGGKAVFKGGEYDSFGDHRIALSLCVAALKADSDIIINNTECINTSFPGFTDLFNSLSADGTPLIEII